jgi:benzoyl-CoA reductase/2-hydroxyglutaryl-CoA dehydratase subunit BcrC/BadD/HgdB
VEFYQKLYDEVKYRAENKISSVPGGEKYRLYWYRIIPWYYIGLYSWLEEHFGATTICDTYEPGAPPSEELIDLDYPLESIARKMYDGVWGVNPFMAHKNLHPVPRHEDLGTFISEYDIDGAVAMLVNSCRHCQDLYHSWRLVKENIGLPTLAIEADMVDDRTYSDAAVKELLRAFMETVDEAKRKRQAT